MNGHFTVRLYGRDLPAAGVPASAWFVGQHLRVVAEPGPELDVAVDQLRIDTGGFDHDRLYLGWDTPAGRLSISPVDAAAEATLVGTAPTRLDAALQRHARGTRRSRHQWRLITGAAAAAALLLASLWWTYGALVSWAADHVPPEAEAKLGAATLAELKKGGKLIEQGPAVDALREIGGRLTAGSRYTYHWALLDEPSINAFAAPGGQVVVHRGLIAAARTPEELAGVLAHEVQHIEQRHTLKSMINGLGVAALATVVLGDVSAVAGMLAYQIGTLSYSRDLEAQADRLGLDALVRARIAPDGMAHFFRTLEKQAPQMPIALLSSHPATDARIEAIEAGIAALPKQDYPPLAIDWAAVQASVSPDRAAAP